MIILIVISGCLLVMLISVISMLYVILWRGPTRAETAQPVPAHQPPQRPTDWRLVRWLLLVAAVLSVPYIAMFL